MPRVALSLSLWQDVPRPSPGLEASAMIVVRAFEELGLPCQARKPFAAPDIA